MVSDFDVVVDVIPSVNSVRLDIRIDGTDGVLTKIEFLLTPGGWFDTSDLRVPGDTGHIAVLKSGTATYRASADTVTITGGFAEHNSTTTMRGSEPHLPDVFSVYCTGYTPLKRSIEITAASRAV